MLYNVTHLVPNRTRLEAFRHGRASGVPQTINRWGIGWKSSRGGRIGWGLGGVSTSPFGNQEAPEGGCLKEKQWPGFRVA